MRRRINPLLLIIGIVLGILVAVGLMFILPGSIDATTKRILFFLVIVVVYFLVTLIGSKIIKR